MTITRRKAFQLLGSGALGAGLGSWIRTAAAQPRTYPVRPVQMVVPFPAGGTTDIIARIVAEELRKTWSQAIVVQNKAGGTGVVGSQFVAKSAPDGYTLLIAIDSSQITAGLLNPPPVFDPVADFSPIGVLATGQFVLVAHHAQPFNSVKELVTYAKANPGKINIGSPGNGTTPHLLAEMFRSAAGVDIVHVPYNGAAPFSLALHTGEVHIGFPSITETVALMGGAGIARPLAAPSLRRIDQLPNVPTMTEVGYPDVRDESMFGMLGPAGMDNALVDRINADLQAALDRPEIKVRLAELGYKLSLSSPKAYAATLVETTKRKKKVITEARIKAG